MFRKGLGLSSMNPRLGLLLATFFWGASFIFVKSLSLLQGGENSLGEFIAASQIFLRFAISAVFLGIVLFLKKEWSLPSRGEWVQGLGAGVFCSLGLLFQIDAIHYTSASISAFLTQGYCLVLPLFEAIRFSRVPTKGSLLSAALVGLGVWILADIDLQNVSIGRGELETLVASLFFAFLIFWIEVKDKPDNRPLMVSFINFVVISIVCLGASLFFSPEMNIVSRLYSGVAVWVFVFALAILCTFASFTFMNLFQPKISSSEAGVIYAAEPFFAGILALFLPQVFSNLFHFEYSNEILTWKLALGGSLILAAGFGSRIFARFLNRPLVEKA